MHDGDKGRGNVKNISQWRKGRSGLVKGHPLVFVLFMAGIRYGPEIISEKVPYESFPHQKIQC